MLALSHDVLLARCPREGTGGIEIFGIHVGLGKLGPAHCALLSHVSDNLACACARMIRRVRRLMKEV